MAKIAVRFEDGAVAAYEKAMAALETKHTEGNLTLAARKAEREGAAGSRAAAVPVLEEGAGIGAVAPVAKPSHGSTGRDDGDAGMPPSVRIGNLSVPLGKNPVPLGKLSICLEVQGFCPGVQKICLAIQILKITLRLSLR